MIFPPCAGGDGAAFLGGLDQVEPLRLFELRVDAVDGGGPPGAGVHAIGLVVGLEERLDARLVGAVEVVGPGGVGLVERAAGEDVVVDGDGGDEQKLAGAGLAGGFEQAEAGHHVPLEVADGGLLQRVPVGGVVDNGVDAGDQSRGDLRVLQLADVELGDERSDVVAAAGGTDEGSDAVAGAVEGGGGVRADESAGAGQGDQVAHGGIIGEWLQFRGRVSLDGGNAR